MYIQGSYSAITESSFVWNHARHKGGAIHSIANSNISINSTNFTSNWANDGGVMTLIDNSDIYLDCSVFINNTARGSGGIMHLHQIESSASVYSSRFNSSHAGINGGVLVAVNSSVNLKGSYFTNNSAHNTGGAVDAYSGSNLTVENSSFLRNNANNSGGGLYIAVDSSGSIFNSTFQQNIAMKCGDAISVLSSSNIVIIGCENKYLDKIAENGTAISANKKTVPVLTSVQTVKL